MLSPEQTMTEVLIALSTADAILANRYNKVEWTISFDIKAVCLAGQCQLHRSGNSWEAHLRFNIPMLQHSKAEARRTAVHELCHAYAPLDSHGYQWAACMVLCGYKPEIYWQHGRLERSKKAAYRIK